jgi:hypothetical protein
MGETLIFHFNLSVFFPNPDEPEPTRIFCPTGTHGKNTDIFLFLAVFIPIRVYNLNFLPAVGKQGFYFKGPICVYKRNNDAFYVMLMRRYGISQAFIE